MHQLALNRSARLIVIVRAGEPAPDAITALWKDRTLPCVDVEPLDRSHTAGLVEAILGGPLKTASLNKIFAVSQGNPRY